MFLGLDWFAGWFDVGVRGLVGCVLEFVVGLARFECLGRVVIWLVV